MKKEDILKKIDWKVLLCVYVFVMGLCMLISVISIDSKVKEQYQEVISGIEELLGDYDSYTYTFTEYSGHSVKSEKMSIPTKPSNSDYLKHWQDLYGDIDRLYKLDYENGQNGYSLIEYQLTKNKLGLPTIYVNRKYPVAVGYKKGYYSWGGGSSVKECVETAYQYEKEQKEYCSGDHEKLRKALLNLSNDSYEFVKLNTSILYKNAYDVFCNEDIAPTDKVLYDGYVHNNESRRYYAQSSYDKYGIKKRADKIKNMKLSSWFSCFMVITPIFIIIYILVKNVTKNSTYTEEDQRETFFKNIFSFKGRIGRLEFIFTGLFWLGCYCIRPVLVDFFSKVKQHRVLYEIDGEYYLHNAEAAEIIDAYDSQFMIVLSVLLFVVATYIFITQSAKRCHDLNKTGWFQLIPFSSLWLAFAKGDEGSNKYDVCDSPEKKQNPDNTTSSLPKKNMLLLVCAALGIALVVTTFMLFKGTDAQEPQTYSPQSDNHEQNKEVVQPNDVQNYNNDQQITNAQSGNNVQLDNKTQTNDNEPTNTDAQPNIPGDYPDASIRVLTASELSGYSKRELKLMRNEIFARHGYIFKTEDMKKYFSSKQWYEPKYNDVNSMLTDIEQQNIGTIKQLEK